MGSCVSVSDHEGTAVPACGRPDPLLSQRSRRQHMAEHDTTLRKASSSGPTAAGCERDEQAQDQHCAGSATGEPIEASPVPLDGIESVRNWVEDAQQLETTTGGVTAAVLENVRGLRELDDIFYDCWSCCTCDFAKGPATREGLGASASDMKTLDRDTPGAAADAASGDATVERALTDAQAYLRLMELLQLQDEGHLFAVLLRLLNGPNVAAEWTITNTQWRKGWLRLRVYSGAAAIAFSTREARWLDSATVKDPKVKALHHFSFRFSKKESRKAMSSAAAAAVAQTILAPKWELAAAWCRFVESERSAPRSHIITIDQWDQLIEFAELFSTAEDVATNYDPLTSAFPGLYDEFVMWLKLSETPQGQP